MAWGLAVMLAWLPQTLTDAGLSEDLAAANLGAYALVGIPLCLLTPALTVRMRRPLILVVVFAATLIVAYTGLAVAPTAAPLLWCVLAGLGTGTFAVVFTLITLRSSTPQGAVALSGFIQTSGYLVAGVGPWAVGVFYGAVGTWATT